jgi:hypothetical protein
MLIIYYQKMSNKYWKISTIFLNKVNRYRSASSYEKKMINTNYGGVIGTFIGLTYGSYLGHVIDGKRIEYCDYFYLMCIGGVGGSFVGLTYQLIPVYIGFYAIDKTLKIYGNRKFKKIE